MLAVMGQIAPVAFVVFLRIGAAMAVLPGFSHVSIPVRVKLAVAVALTAVVAPAVAPSISLATMDTGTLARSLLSETLIGLALGFTLRLAIMTLEMAGTMAAQATSLSQLFGAGGEPMPTISHILVFAGLALAMAAGLHTRTAEVIILSYDTLPVAQLPDASLLRSWSLGHLSAAFELAFSLAAPFVLAGLAYNVALGAINRAMPQLMVAFVGAPAISAGALALLAIAAPTGLVLWLRFLDRLLADPFGGGG